MSVSWCCPAQPPSPACPASFPGLPSLLPLTLRSVQLSLAGDSLQQSSQPLGISQSPWRQQSRWDSAGWAALSLCQRADGTFLAAVEGRQLPHVPPALPRQLAAAVAGFRALALLSIALLLLSGAARLPTLRGLLLRRRWGAVVLAWTAGQPAASSRAACKAEDALGGGCGIAPRLHHLGGAALLEAGLQHEGSNSCGDGQPRSRCSSASSTHHRSAAASAASSSSSAALPCYALGSPSASGAAGRRKMLQPLLARLRALPWRLLLTAATLAAALLGLWAARSAARIAAPFAEPPVAAAVQGQHSRFTLMVMSYDCRLKELRWYVQHYSRCPSVGERCGHGGQAVTQARVCVAPCFPSRPVPTPAAQPEPRCTAVGARSGVGACSCFSCALLAAFPAPPPACAACLCCRRGAGGVEPWAAARS